MASPIEPNEGTNLAPPERWRISPPGNTSPRIMMPPKMPKFLIVALKMIVMVSVVDLLWTLVVVVVSFTAVLVMTQM